jgi:hypothetical protein
LLNTASIFFESVRRRGGEKRRAAGMEKLVLFRRGNGPQGSNFMTGSAIIGPERLKSTHAQ